MAYSRNGTVNACHVPFSAMPHSAAVRIGPVRHTCRKPSTMSRQTRPAGTGWGGGSRRRIAPRVNTDTTYEAASTAIATGAPNACTMSPAMPGPPSSAPDRAASMDELAASSRSRPTSAGTNASSATWKKTSQQPATTAMAHSRGSVSMCVQARTGTSPSRTVRSALALTRISRLRCRSAYTPASSGRPRNGSHTEPSSTPRPSGVACRVSTASSGVATRVTDEPVSDTACPPQKRQKSRSRHSPVTGWAAMGRSYGTTGK